MPPIQPLPNHRPVKGTGTELDTMIHLLSKLPGLGPRSGRRAALYLLRHRDTLLGPLVETMAQVAATMGTCTVCGNYDVQDPCAICADPSRDRRFICVVEGVADLWAMERSGAFRGYYHVLGGSLSAVEGIGPDQLRLAQLLSRIDGDTTIDEVILALNATIDGQTTTHYIADMLSNRPIRMTTLSIGVPMGGELDFLDDGTLLTAVRSRRAM